MNMSYMHLSYNIHILISCTLTLYTNKVLLYEDLVEITQKKPQTIK